MPITTYVSGGKEYLYFIYYDASSGKQRRVYCGPKDDPDSEKKADELERRRVLLMSSFRKSKQEFLEKEYETIRRELDLKEE